MTKMENNQNRRRPKWKTTKMEEDQNGRRPKWKTTKMDQMKYVQIGRQHNGGEPRYFNIG